MPCARLPNSLAYVESVSRVGGHVLGDDRCRLVPTGVGEATTCNTSIGPVLRGSSCAVIVLIKKTTRQSCARTPPTPGSRAASGMPSSGVGGLPFAVDPKLSADQATVFWRADALPTVVPLAPSPTSFTGARAIDFAELGEVKERTGPDGRHIIIRTDSGELRGWVLDDQVEQPVALALPLDDDLPNRVPAALRLSARIVHPGNPGTSPLVLTRQRHDRLMLMLRALDGHLADASYREIAQVLFGARRLELEPWKTSSLRDMTIRLVKGGRVLMQAGYRKLLRGR